MGALSRSSNGRTGRCGGLNNLDKDRQLDFDDILHYQKIIVALSETDRIMREIDIVDIT